ncbi:hypothetical protein ACMBCN_01735, partial [Candidatus Liberibacter asiaticus]|nr:hypothetical protein [Candidatus Liberibacter asiaticus]
EKYLFHVRNNTSRFPKTEKIAIRTNIQKLSKSEEKYLFDVRNKRAAPNPKQVARYPPATPLDLQKTESRFTVPSIIQALMP